MTSDSRVSNAFRQDETAQRNKEAEEKANLVDWVDAAGRLKIGGYFVTSASPSKDTVYIGFTGQLVQTVSMNANPVEVMAPDGIQRCKVYVRTSEEWKEVMVVRKRRDSILEEKLANARAEAEREIMELSEDWTDDQGSEVPVRVPASASTPVSTRDSILTDLPDSKGDEEKSKLPESFTCGFEEPHFDCDVCRTHHGDPEVRRQHETTADHKTAAGTLAAI
tara:strand:+ start:1620 stop:2285 length:666 start_codon:yes stop_codon:yes gene_type:complete